MNWKNPLPMRGYLERTWLFAYQTPPEAAARRLPEPLEPVVHGGRAFWHLVVCRIRDMRPRGAPPWLGLDYWHVAYRILARCRPVDGPPLEGLYFVRSDCDHRAIAAGASLLTAFRTRYAPVRVTETPDEVRIRVDAPDAPASAVLDRSTAPRLPEHSAFPSVEAATRCLKYGPVGLSPAGRGAVHAVFIRREESAWRARPLHVVSAEWAFLRGEPVLPELAFEVAPIEYGWERGRTIPTRPRPSGTAEDGPRGSQERECAAAKREELCTGFAPAKASRYECVRPIDFRRHRGPG